MLNDPATNKSIQSSCDHLEGLLRSLFKRDTWPLGVKRPLGKTTLAATLSNNVAGLN